MENKIEFKLTISSEGDADVSMKANSTQAEFLAGALVSIEAFANAASQDDVIEKIKFLINLKDAISKILLSDVL